MYIFKSAQQYRKQTALFVGFFHIGQGPQSRRISTKKLVTDLFRTTSHSPRHDDAVGPPHPTPGQLLLETRMNHSNDLDTSVSGVTLTASSFGPVLNHVGMALGPKCACYHVYTQRVLIKYISVIIIWHHIPLCNHRFSNSFFHPCMKKQPVYLHAMLAASIPSRSLRSNKGNSLSVPRDKTNTDAKAFYSCAPSLWINLPLSVHSANSVATFKKHLKTHIFDLACSP